MQRDGKFTLHGNALCLIACIIYFAEDAVRVIIGNALPVFTTNQLTWLMIALMYLPLIGALGLEPSRVWPALGRFFLLFIAVAAFFYVTYLIHPEYSGWFFDSAYPINEWIFQPNQFLYAYLFISIVRKPEDAIKALKLVAYLLLAYYTFKLVRARILGYWITTTTSAGAVEAEYDLNYGYDHLLVFSIFFACGFKEKKLLYFLMAAISVLEILLGGSRGPLLAVSLMLLLMYFRFRREVSPVLRGAILSAALLVAALVLVLGFQDFVIFIGSLLSKVLGSSSRTLDTMMSGEKLLDGTGRDRLYAIAIDMIKTGFWGYGAYGDRYVIGQVFWVGYAHNIFFELLIDFGWILGGFFIVKMAIAVFRMLFQCKDNDWYLLFMIFFIPSIKLLLSGSFWFLDSFWAAIAVYHMYRSRVMKKRLAITVRGGLLH